MFCGLLFSYSPLLFWPSHCLSFFDLRSMVTNLVKESMTTEKRELNVQTFHIINFKR